MWDETEREVEGEIRSLKLIAGEPLRRFVSWRFYRARARKTITPGSCL